MIPCFILLELLIPIFQSSVFFLFAFFVFMNKFCLKKMKMSTRSYTITTEFVLLGILDNPELQFVMFISLYMACTECHWKCNHHCPHHDRQSFKDSTMYFFLQNVSFLELSFGGAIITKVKTVSYTIFSSIIFRHLHVCARIFSSNCRVF